MNNLWFLLFLIVPIIVHLFNFRRARRLLFTNVRFIQKVSTETKSKTRLKHLLVLISRSLAFMFLVLTFIFFIRGSSSLTQNGSAGISVYLDNSLSSLGDDISDEVSLIDRIISESPATKGVLLTNDFSPFSNRMRARSELIDELPEIGFSYISRSLGDVLRRIVAEEIVYLISDFQEAEIEDLTVIATDSTKKFYLLRGETQSFRNVFVDSLWVERDIDDYNNVILSCTIGKTTDFKEGNIVVKLIAEDGSQISSVVKDVGSSLGIEFSLPDLSSSSFFKIQLSGDDLEYDNEFFFTVDKPNSPRILLLTEEPNRYLSSVFSNSQLFQFSISNTSQIDYELIENSDLLVVNNYYELPSGLMGQNTEFSSIVVFPPDSINVLNYEEALGFLLTPILSAGFSEIEVGDNSLLAGIYQKFGSTIDMPRGNAKYQVSGYHDPVLKLRSGFTYLAASVNAPLYFFTAPLTDEFTELPNHAIFLPLMYRIAEQSINRDEFLYAYPGDFFEVSRILSEIPPKIISKNLEMVPEFSVQNEKSLIKIPTDLPPGFYHLVQENDTIRSFGLNLPQSESVFETWGLDELQSFFSESPHVRIISTSESVEEVALPSNEDSSIWKYALLLTLIFILVETAFHRYLK